MQVTITGASIRRFLGTLLVLGVVAAAVYGLVRLASRDPFGGLVEQDRWQAVFLSNDRVYFGRLRPGGADVYELRDAYFIEQGRTDDDKPRQEVKPITQELQGPDGRILLRKDHVIAIENLRRDSEVVQAINRVRTAAKN